MPRVDEWLMTGQRLATVLLACAALGSLAFAAVRIAAAKAGDPIDDGKHVRIYGTTPSLAAATLASLRRPPGFRDMKCFGHGEQGWRCWSKSPSLPLDESGMRRLIQAMGVRQISIYEASQHDEVSGIVCMGYHVFRKHHLELQTCLGLVLKGNERLFVSVNSLLLPSRKPTTRVIRPSWNYPTEVEISVIGHFEHEGE